VALMQRSSKALINCRGNVLRQLQMIDNNVPVKHECPGIVESIRSVVTQSADDGDAGAFCRR